MKLKNQFQQNGKKQVHLDYIFIVRQELHQKMDLQQEQQLHVGIISRLCNLPVRNDVAMTGEINLRGQVTAIGE